MTTLAYYVGFVVLFRSIAAIGMSLDLKKTGILEWGTLMAAGILGSVLGILLLAHPLFAGASLLTLVSVDLPDVRSYGDLCFCETEERCMIFPKKVRTDGS